SRNLKSLAAAPSLISAYTSRFNSSASCHTSKPWYRLTPAMRRGASRAVPDLATLHRTSNPEPRTPNGSVRGSNVSEASRTAAKPPPNDMRQPHVVVIGGGVNGLVAATLLARSGMNVLLLERSDRVGGCVRTSELAPGFRCPTLAHAAAIDPELVGSL